MSRSFRSANPWPYGLTVVPPVSPDIAPPEPLSLEEVKLHLRVDGHEEDFLIEMLLKAAREHIETVTRYQLVTTKYRYDLACFPAVIRLPKPPLQSVTGIAYRDSTGTLTTVAPADYQVFTTSIPAHITAVSSWPSPSVYPDAVQITYVAGFGAPSAVPAHFKALILLLAADLYEHREAELDSLGSSRLMENRTFQSLLGSTRLVEV